MLHRYVLIEVYVFILPGSMRALDSKIGIQLLEREHPREVTDAHLLIRPRAKELTKVVGKLVVEMGV